MPRFTFHRRSPDKPLPGTRTPTMGKRVSLRGASVVETMECTHRATGNISREKSRRAAELVPGIFARMAEREAREKAERDARSRP